MLPESETMLPIQKCIAGSEIRSLSDLELLAILLGTGVRDFDVLDVSSLLLKKYGGLIGIAGAGLYEIVKNQGVGIKKAIRIHAAFELGKRVIVDPRDIREINSPETVWRFLLPEMAGMQHEEFRVLILNAKNRLLRNSVVSRGTISSTLVHPREVFRDAIREGGSGIIIAHNHPSGVLEPSQDDIRTTHRISEAGVLLGIPLMDHVIITNSAFLSMKECGFL